MAKTVEANVPRKARSQMGEVWHQFRRNKGAMVGSAIVLIIVFVALFADVFLDYDTQGVGQNVAERLPNCLSPIIVQATLRVASAIISASSLSFLGLGVPAPSPEWGALLSGGRKYIRDYSYMTLFPGLAIMITVLALNMMGDGLRDSLDPKLKK